ncbi:hypothetical protein CFC21_005467, partial [Triticum aestivum]
WARDERGQGCRARVPLPRHAGARLLQG